MWDEGMLVSESYMRLDEGTGCSKKLQSTHVGHLIIALQSTRRWRTLHLLQCCRSRALPLIQSLSQSGLSTSPSTSSASAPP